MITRNICWFWVKRFIFWSVFLLIIKFESRFSAVSTSLVNETGLNFFRSFFKFPKHWIQFVKKIGCSFHFKMTNSKIWDVEVPISSSFQRENTIWCRGRSQEAWRENPLKHTREIFFVPTYYVPWEVKRYLLGYLRSDIWKLYNSQQKNTSRLIFSFINFFSIFGKQRGHISHLYG